MRGLLRSLPVFAGTTHEFDTDDLPSTPADLFARWIAEAMENGVVNPTP